MTPENIDTLINVSGFCVLAYLVLKALYGGGK